MSDEDLSYISVAKSSTSSDWNRIAIATRIPDGYGTVSSFERFVFLYDREGRILWKNGFKENIVPCLSKDGSMLAVRAGRQIHYYRFQQRQAEDN